MSKRDAQCWLFKTEPESYSIDHLAAEKDRRTFWNGVRNYQARNMLRDQIQVGDRVLLYHSNANPPAIVGVAKVVRAGYPDFTAWDPMSDYFDPKSTAESPIWFMVDIELVKKYARPLPLPELREHKGLEKMELLRKGSRLSIQPVRPEEFAAIEKL